MDLEETDARNDCAGEGQQQCNGPNNHTIPLALAAMLLCNTQEQQPHLSTVAQACPATVGETSAWLLWGTTNKNIESTGSGSWWKQFVSELVQSSRSSISADHDRAQWGRDRRRAISGHHKTVLELKDKNYYYNS
jgi:hypothetical protein